MFFKKIKKKKLKKINYKTEGDYFEDLKYDLRGKNFEQKIITYYLPQFYAFKENDEWWGKGFTEWRNVVRGESRFEGHYQPKLPRDLGFYSLNDEEVIKSQVELAKKAGIFGFCFYYYWFNGKRMLDVPLDKLLNNKSIEMPFCLMWANENWTRTWDGLEKDILIKQDYSDEDDEDLVKDLVKYFSDKRYININNRPLFFIYRPGIIPNCKQKITKLRHIFKSKYEINPLIFMAQSFEDLCPNKYGLDGAVEFPPHKLTQNVLNINSSLKFYNKDEFDGQYWPYESMISGSKNETENNYDLIRCITPDWDNEARRPNKGQGFVGSTPEKYYSWLRYALDYSKKHKVHDESFVFINAWNEWAEGAYLEPDIYWGSAYLNATAKALVDENN